MVLCSSGKSPSYGLPATNFSKLRIILLVFSCLSIAWIIAPVLSLSLCLQIFINTHQSVLFVFVLVNETSGIGLCCVTEHLMARSGTDLKMAKLMPPTSTSTSEALAMTQAAIKKLVANSVSAALEAQAANKANY
ncbi:hypothetical protein Tco_0740528 [Tanacetum coccineum]